MLSKVIEAVSDSAEKNAPMLNKVIEAVSDNAEKNSPPTTAEIHQQSDGKEHETLTTMEGCPISDDQNSLKAGIHGAALLEDFVFREKMFHFDHERIPERVVHARGYGIHGYFENYESLSDITRADLFQKKGEKTPVFVRFSTVVGNKGSQDLARDVRGFATKFYTKEGNWDLVGNNIPVFFIQDPIKFPDLIHAAKPEPDREIPQAQTAHDNFWDFISLMPESMHMIMWVMSDRAIPRSYRFMEGFGVHTFRFVNKKNESTFVKFHWKPKLGMQSVLWNEAIKISGADPDFHRRDIWESINSQAYPEWELGVQIFDEKTINSKKFKEEFPFDILDSTKFIPESLIPVKPIGRLVLDRLVNNFFAETEQVAFCTSNVVPGIDFSNDPLLHGRNFSYLDTQLKRLGGPNFTHLPINQPRQCPFKFGMNFHRDGHMYMKCPKGRINYEPNGWNEEECAYKSNDTNDESKIENPRESKSHGFTSYPEQLNGNKTRQRSPSFSDHYSQARQFYISQTDIEKQHIIDALTFELSKVEKKSIRVKMVSHLLNIDNNMGESVATNLGFIQLPKPIKPMIDVDLSLKPDDALSIIKNGPQSFKGRKVGILVTDGFDAKLFDLLKATITKEQAVFQLVAPTINGATGSDQQLYEADHMINGGPSVIFDSVVLLLNEKYIKQLNEPNKKPYINDFINDAFAHKKFIGYSKDALLLLKQQNIPIDDGVIELTNEKDCQNFIQQCRDVRFWKRV